jgi:acyl carrier protein
MEGALPEGDLADQLDSMQRLTLVVAIEDRFLICFEPEDEVGVVTLQDLVATIQVKLQERPCD